MRNDQMLGFKAGYDFQNDKVKVDTKGTEHLPTMTNNYDITGHVTRRGAKKQANWPTLEGQFLINLHLKNLSRMSMNLIYHSLYVVRYCLRRANNFF